MDDLISRQQVIDLLKKSASRDIEEVVITEKHINLIKDMPVAYDVDAVVAELEENSHNEFSPAYGGNYQIISVYDAIDTVRKGGVE